LNSILLLNLVFLRSGCRSFQFRFTSREMGPDGMSYTNSPLLCFASIQRWTSGERMTKSQGLSFANKSRLRRSFCSRSDAGFRRWNSKVRSRRHRDRCYATDTEVGCFNDRDV